MKPDTKHPSYTDEIMRKFESVCFRGYITWVIKFALIAEMKLTWDENITEPYVTFYKTVAQIFLLGESKPA
jgi:hypothetical protein